MKSKDQPSLNFSASPLKVVTGISPDSSARSPFLKAILNGKTKAMSRVRVLPMVNPYKRTAKPMSALNGKLAKEAEPTNNEWFNNYE